MPLFAIVIPAFNEARTITRVIDTALAQSGHVIVVDDASHDATAELVAKKPVILIRHAVNRGKAAALMSGIEKARSMGLQCVVTIDGDGQHDVRSIDRFLVAFAENPHAVIVGARLLNREQAPGMRLFANRFADFWIGWAAGRAIADTQCGLRLYPLTLFDDVLDSLEYSNGFVFESEVLIEACRHGYGVVSVPIASCYPPDRRKSHFRPVLDICKITKMVAVKLLKRGLYPQGLVRSLVEQPVIVWDR
jgi:glycosyltransferase involved in cell wall biosynthesis